MRGRIRLVVMVGLLATGCAMAQDVKLRHPDGRAVTCEPGWRYGVIGATVGQDQVRDCVKDYQRQGYERVP
jgi:hypothetical protein